MDTKQKQMPYTPRLLNIVKGSRVRQCTETDFAAFAARGFTKVETPGEKNAVATPEQLPAPTGKNKANK